VAICTTKTAILSGGEQVVPVDSRAQGAPGVGHGQAVVRVRHGAQALLQLVALAALRPGPPDRLRRPAAADPNAAAATAAAAATGVIAASAAAEAGRAESSESSYSSSSSSSSSYSSTSSCSSNVRHRTEREMARGRRGRFADQSGRQTHAVYLNQRRVYSFGRAQQQQQ